MRAPATDAGAPWLLDAPERRRGRPPALSAGAAGHAPAAAEIALRDALVAGLDPFWSKNVGASLLGHLDRFTVGAVPGSGDKVRSSRRGAREALRPAVAPRAAWRALAGRCPTIRPAGHESARGRAGGLR